MVTILGKHLRSAQMSKLGPASPLCSGKGATNQGSSLGEHSRGADRMKTRSVRGAGKKNWVDIMHTSWSGVKLHRELKLFHFWTSLADFESTEWVLNLVFVKWTNFQVGFGAKRCQNGWGIRMWVWSQRSTSPQEICKEGITVQKEWKLITAVVECFLILGVFSAAYQKMTGLSSLPYVLDSTWLHI